MKTPSVQKLRLLYIIDILSKKSDEDTVSDDKDLNYFIEKEVKRVDSEDNQ